MGTDDPNRTSTGPQTPPPPPVCPHPESSHHTGHRARAGAPPAPPTLRTHTQGGTGRGHPGALQPGATTDSVTRCLSRNPAARDAFGWGGGGIDTAWSHRGRNSPAPA